MSREQMHPWLRAAAVRALRRGLVELAHPSPLAVALALGNVDTALLKLAPAGRARLKLPTPAPLGERDPLDVLRDAIRFAYGHDRFDVLADPAGRLIARAIGREDAHGSLWWLATVVAAYATEQGVPCRQLRNDVGSLVGFERVEVANG